MNPNIFYAIAGFALLLYALRHLTESLDREVARHLGGSLQRFTRHPLQAFCAGAGITALVQASSVTIITTMGFLNRGLLPLDKAVMIMLGAAVGSTLKGWLSAKVSLALGPLLLITGAIGLVTVRDQRRRRFFEVVISIGMTFLGLLLIETGLSPLAQTPYAQSILRISLDAGTLPILKTIFCGIVLSVALQSGSAVLLLVIHGATQGLISLPAALGLILGANVGTTSTPLLASLSQSGESKRLAVSYCVVKILAVTLVMTYFRTHSALLEDLGEFFGVLGQPAFLIVAFHTWFNLMNALTWWLMLPLLLRNVALLVPLQETEIGTSPFTLRIQKLLGSLPGRAISEGVNKVQQVIRDLHWVSDSIFHVLDGKVTRIQASHTLTESLQKCERSIEVLDTVRNLAWRSFKAPENSPDHLLESRKKILGLIFLTADLKTIESMLHACIQSLSFEGATILNPSGLSAQRLQDIRERLNDSWERLFSLETYQEASQSLNPDLYGKEEGDDQLLEITTRLQAIQLLLNPTESLKNMEQSLGTTVNPQAPVRQSGKQTREPEMAL